MDKVFLMIIEVTFSPPFEVLNKMMHFLRRGSSRFLNILNHNEHLRSFSRDTRGSIINHLAYADDIIIFCHQTC